MTRLLDCDGAGPAADEVGGSSHFSTAVWVSLITVSLITDY